MSDRMSDGAGKQAGGFGPMSADEWRVFGPLVNTALDTPPERRAQYIADACRGDAAMIAQLRQLVEECEQGDAMLDAGAIERFSFLLDDDETVPRFPATLAGRYRVDREIGRGGWAIVFLAHDTAHDRPVAVKVLRPSARERAAPRDPGQIRTTAALRHPHIVPLYDSGEAEESLYYVMPYYDGGTLSARLEPSRNCRWEKPSRIAFDVAQRRSSTRTAPAYFTATSSPRTFSFPAGRRCSATSASPDRWNGRSAASRRPASSLRMRRST